MDNLENMVLFGRRVKELRTQQGLSLRRLGMMTGLGHGYLSEVENGLHDIRLGTVFKIVGSLGVTMNEFFNWE